MLNFLCGLLSHVLWWLLGKTLSLAVFLLLHYWQSLHDRHSLSSSYVRPAESVRAHACVSRGQAWMKEYSWCFIAWIQHWTSVLFFVFGTCFSVHERCFVWLSVVWPLLTPAGRREGVKPWTWSAWWINTDLLTWPACLWLAGCEFSISVMLFHGPESSAAFEMVALGKAFLYI